MFNMAVLRLKDIIKYGIVFIISLSVIVFCTNSFIEINNKKASEVKRLEKPNFLANKSFVEILDQTVPEIENINGKYKKDNLNDKAKNKNNILEIMLKTQISSIKGITSPSKTCKRLSCWRTLTSTVRFFITGTYINLHLPLP